MDTKERLKYVEYLKQDLKTRSSEEIMEGWKKTHLKSVYKTIEKDSGIQDCPTHESLCKEIVGKLKENSELSNKKILTLNIEFVNVLGNEDITFFSDYPKKSDHVRAFYPNVKVIEGDFLKWEMDMKFDVVIMNPPYQGTGRKKPYIGFIQKAVDIIHKNGFICCVSPRLSVNFILGQEVSQKKMTETLNIKTLSFDDKIKKYFNGIGSDFCYFVCKKGYTGEITNFFDKNGDEHSIDIKPNTLFPFIYSPITYSIINKCMNGRNEWNRSAARIEKDLIDNENPTHKNKILYKILTHKEEYKWSSFSHNDFNKIKVLYPTVGNRFIVDNGSMFPGTSFVVYVTFDSIVEANNCKWIMEKSKLFQWLYSMFDTMRSPLDYVVRNVKKIKIDKEQLSDYDVFSYFDLSEEEINVIERDISNKQFAS